MTINIKKDRIEFVSNEGTTYTLRETGDGFSFDGVIEGTNIFQDGFQGTRFGYTSGGYSPPNSNTIDKFPFAADSNATDVGDLTVARFVGTGQSSFTNGYASGGTPPAINTIEKFPFATDGNATDVGDLTVARFTSGGQSSATHGYTAGGYAPEFNVIDKFPFATNGNATDVGDLTVARRGGGSQSSSTFGYQSGGLVAPPATNFLNTIDKFPFSTDTNATDVGDLTQGRSAGSGQSSISSGYTSGGTPFVNTIDKFPFSTDTNATDVGDLATVGDYTCGQSSTVSGYISGLRIPPGAGNNTIEKFPFFTDSNATDVGDLTQARRSGGGQQD